MLQRDVRTRARIKWNSGDGTPFCTVLASLWRIAEWEFICQGEAEATHPGRRTDGPKTTEWNNCDMQPGQAGPAQCRAAIASLSCSACLAGSSDHFAWDARRSLPDAWCLVLVCHEPNTRRSFDTCYPRSKFVATMRKFTFILHFNFVLCGLFNFLFANGINFDAMLEMSSSLPRFVSPSQRNKTYQWRCIGSCISSSSTHNMLQHTIN